MVIFLTNRCLTANWVLDNPFPSLTEYDLAFGAGPSWNWNFETMAQLDNGMYCGPKLIQFYDALSNQPVDSNIFSDLRNPDGNNVFSVVTQTNNDNLGQYTLYWKV